MIAEICFTADWLEKKRKELKGIDPSLLERALHAFALLGHLSESGLDFVFKGGTSLLLHVPTIRRLSIDIDILCSSPAAELDRVLKEVSGVSPFVRYEEDERGSRGLPQRRHFKFFYAPLVSGNPAPYVFLDVVEEPHVPHEVIVKPITPEILEIRREIPVNIPTVESLLADKLAAFAPRTIGVPFTPPNGKPADTMQIAKQLFDVGELFNIADDLNAVRRVYKRVFDLENGYRGGGFILADVQADTLSASQSLSHHRLKGIPDNTDALILEDGVKRLTSHLVNHRFNLDAAKVAAAKAGLLSRLIAKTDAKAQLSSWRAMPEIEVLKGLKIEGEWERLNRLKAINAEAFWYWYQASRV